MRYGEWIGRVTLALIFLCNAVGVVDQTRAANELAAQAIGQFLARSGK